MNPSRPQPVLLSARGVLQRSCEDGQKAIRLPVWACPTAVDIIVAGWYVIQDHACPSTSTPWFIHVCHPALLPACHEVDPCRVRADVAASCDRSRRRSKCAGPASTTTKPSSQATRSTERGGREARSDVLLDWLWPEMMPLSGEG